MTTLGGAMEAAEGRRRELERSSRPRFLVGTATCGRAAGALETRDHLRADLDGRGIEADVVEVGCLGLCSFEPLVVVRKAKAPPICYGAVGPAQASRLVADYVLDGDPCADLALGVMGNKAVDGIRLFADHPMLRGQERRVLGNCGIIDPGNVDDYLARGGYRGFLRALELGPYGVLEEVRASGLRGRGGAGFPVWRKWDLCRSTRADQRYLICNADEGDPGAFMDRSLIEGDPHAVIEGMLIAAYCLGADKGYVYCRAEYPLALERLDAAIEQARGLGLLGENIGESGFSFDLAVKKGAGAFVCGEETALIASIEGRRGMPYPKPPFPAQQGLWGKPTTIQNVETLGNLPLILRHGAEWYAGRGSEGNAGTKTFALAGTIKRPGLIEVPLGTPLRQIVEDIGGGSDTPIKAVQTGGPSGGCIPADSFDIPVDYESLAAAGSIMGSGGMIVLDEGTCMVDLAKYFLSFTQSESCGKCPPCRVGTRAMHYILDKITRGEGEPADIARLETLARTVCDASLCGLGRTAPNPVLTTLRAFRQEYEDHIEHRRCRAFVCADLVSYHIDAKRCTGCTACAKACPTGAVSGARDKAHAIDPALCSRCGTCLDVCPPACAAVYRESGGLVRYETPRPPKGAAGRGTTAAKRTAATRRKATTGSDRKARRATPAKRKA